MMLRGLRAAGIAAPRLALRRCTAGEKPLMEQAKTAMEPEKAVAHAKEHGWKPDAEWWQVGIAFGGLGVGIGGLGVGIRQYQVQLEQRQVQLEQSHGYIIGQAVAKIMEPFVAAPGEPQNHVVKRAEHEVIKKRLTNGHDARTTIIAGQFQVGKTLAVENALEGEKGVVKVTVDTGHPPDSWKEKLYKSIGVDNHGMFKEALREAKKQLVKPPLLYLDVPRHSTANMNEVSVFCKEFVTDEGVARGVVVASQLSVALGFDAGGKERQCDIWVGPMTKDEAREYLSENFPKVQKADAERIIDEVGTNTGALKGVAQDITGSDTKKAMSVDEALKAQYQACKAEVEALLAIKLQGCDGEIYVGKEIAQALLKSDSETVDHSEWRKRGIPGKMVAAAIKAGDAFAISFNIVTKLWHFASPMHKKAVKELSVKAGLQTARLPG